MSIVKINSLKYNNTVNYEWNTTLLEHTEKHLLVKGEPGRKLTHHGKGKIFTMENPCIEFFPFNDWFTVSIERTPDNLLNYYCNVCMPSTLSDNVLSFIDLDFDVIKEPNGEWTLVDEDEFIVNSNRYGYPSKLIHKAIKEKEMLLEKIHNSTFPFNGWLEELVFDLTK